jgi:Fe(3+) dicitrate transport protein
MLVAGALLASSDVAAEGDVSSLITVSSILPASLGDVAGSVQVISESDLDRMQPITLKDVLRRAPGLHLIDEDALGQKLNISVRGLNARRSGRTLLLEDGAPLQPAPYADPSAHHYPPLDRIARIEFRKGSGQILFGPQSIGGMINFITAPVPSGPLLSGSATAGGRGFARAQLAAGLGSETQGFRIDLVGTDSPGIRNAHRTHVGEIAFKAQAAPGPDHRLTLKAAYLAERSRLTESGLTEARFAADPYANPFADDDFVLDRVSGQIVHEWQLAPSATLTTQVYYADTFRASYRQTDTSTDAMTANPATGCVGTARTDYETAAALCGNKMRPRRFRFWGIEPRLDLGYTLGSFSGAVEFGARLHLEDTRRRRFNGLTPDARETSPGTLLRDDNIIATDAVALHVQNILRHGRLSISTGLRIEDIVTRNRAIVANFIPVDVAARSRQRIALPGAGITWGSEALTVFAGIHRGFAPARPDRDVDPLRLASPVRPERSTEIEIGLRGQSGDALSFEATLFNMALDDLIVEGPLVGGRSGSFVNAGTARHRGLEISGKAAFGSAHATVAYTWLAEAEFTSDVGDAAVGVRGNRIPYAPEHMVDIGVGATTSFGVSGEIGVNHVSRQFANADNRTTISPDGQSGPIPPRTLARVALRYAPPHLRWHIFATVENVFDRHFISSRTDGLFAGQRRQWIAGIWFNI